MAIDVAAELSDRTYEGPFDLLLQLILAAEVDIHEVSLARIVDAYLAEIERLQAVDLDVATEFLLIAATLVELKARRLLPGPATSTSTTSSRCGRSATCCSPGSWSARRSRTSRGCSGRSPTRPGAASHAWSAPTSASPAWRPIRWPG